MICDVARPQDMNPDEVRWRPDVLVIDSGEIKLPGSVDIGYNIGLPPGVVFACMAETILLTLEGRFERYTLGRELDLAKVKEMLSLFHKHGFALAPLRAFDQPLSEADFGRKRAHAQAMLADPALRQRVCAEAATAIAGMVPMAKGVQRKENQ